MVECKHSSEIKTIYMYIHRKREHDLTCVRMLIVLQYMFVYFIYIYMFIQYLVIMVLFFYPSLFLTNLWFQNLPIMLEDLLIFFPLCMISTDLFHSTCYVLFYVS